MAEVVDEMPAGSRSSKYPWDTWLDGQVWLVEHEELGDSVKPGNFAAGVYNAARSRDLKATVRNTAEGIYIQALPVDGSSPDPAP